ncbi:MAG TPA: F0F1 ATP synthase subunit A [Baekduia sp.]|uniref:F0F1 ATP synthase subunit A n=1 Tax=Baekduia sp. TaxID=2600305 RepID=UPI002CF320A6|nr:F0F1 ATP synthase subunit A [Baekduia sp.]HMJ32331.1 F0F1 ATP synthase subunit A [Baekduia sp.]
MTATAPPNVLKTPKRRRWMQPSRAAILLTPLIALLASPAGAFALNINENFHPQNEFKLDPWIDLGTFSINKAVFYVIVASALTCFTMIYVAKRMTERPNKVQTAVESAFLLMRDNITRGNMDDKMAAKWFPFIGALFLFIWFSNMLGYLPLPTNTEHKVDIFGLHIPSFALYAATANISVPLVLTLIVWVSYHVEGIRAKGFVGYLKSWVPAGVEGPATGPIFVIEVISHFVRLVSLSVRLFANILAGHLLILFMGGGLVVLLNLSIFGSVILGSITGVMAVAFFIFEVALVATLQAFIFATLTAIYLGGAVAAEH